MPSCGEASIGGRDPFARDARVLPVGAPEVDLPLLLFGLAVEGDRGRVDGSEAYTSSGPPSEARPEIGTDPRETIGTAGWFAAGSTAMRPTSWRSSSPGEKNSPREGAGP